MRPLLIETPRLLLRPLDEGDGALYARLYADPKVMRHIAPPMEPDAAAASFEMAWRLQAEQAVFPPRWIVVRRDGDTGIGLMGLIADSDRSAGNGSEGSSAVEIGIMLLGEAQRQAFAREALAAAVEALLERGWAHAFWARHAPANIAMARVFDSLGFGAAIPDAAGCRREMTAGRWRRQGGRSGRRSVDAAPRAGSEGATGLP